MKTTPMPPMTSVEAHFRVKVEMENIKASMERLNTLEFVLPGGAQHEAKFNCLEDAVKCLNAAREKLKAFPALLDLQTAMSISVAALAEQRRCAEVGSGVVVPFSKES